VKTSRVTRRLCGFEAEIGLKNLKRSRRKYRATVVSLVISLVLFLTVSSYSATAQTIADAVDDGYNFDICVQDAGLSDAQRESLNTDIAAMELVDGFTSASKLIGYTQLNESMISAVMAEALSGYEEMPGTLPVSLVSLDEKSFAAYAKAAGVSAADFADAQQPRAILINYGQSYVPTEGNNVKKVAGDVLSLRAGDTLSFTAGDPEAPAGQGVALIIGAVTRERPMGVLTGSFAQVTLIVTDEVWSHIAGAISGAELEKLGMNGYLDHAVYMTAQEDQRLEAQLNELTQNLPASGYSIYNLKDMARSEQNLNTFLGVFVYGFIILISLICIANIFNTVTTNIALRRREFAMLRSVGMTPNSFNRMIRFESIFYGLKALLWGCRSASESGCCSTACSST
jgi:putative ABC transport system permease protein